MHQPLSRRPAAILAFALLALLPASLAADPLTKQLDVDFGKDVASRNLHGLATRSDGRILPGPVFTDLDGPSLGEILWTLKAAGNDRFVVGTGPEGKVQEVTYHRATNTYTTREAARVDESQAISVLPLPDATLLVGTSPTAALYLFKNGKKLARVPLPAESVFALLLLPDGNVLAGTGSPGMIYRIDLKLLAKAGNTAGEATATDNLAAHGVTLFGEIRDANIRTLARLTDGRIIAGSSPRGLVYSFAPGGGAPQILEEYHDSEVVDLLPVADGGFYAAIVSTPGLKSHLLPDSGPKSAVNKEKNKDKDEPPEFTGRSRVVYFPADGFPEGVFAKDNVALYRLARHQAWLLLTGGDLGDAFGYDPETRRSLTFAGSASAQLNDLAPLDADRYLVLRNNAPGLALLSFAETTGRELKTKRLDLGQPSEFGDFQFDELHGLAPAEVQLEVRANNGSDELEGWTPWKPMQLQDGGYHASNLRGRYAEFRLRLADSAKNFQLEKGSLYYLPQDRRPDLIDFRIFAPGLGLVPAAEQPPSASATLSQVLFPSPRDNSSDADRRKGAIMGSQVIPQPGTQLVFWTVVDPDGDTLAYTFSIRPENSSTWTDLAVDTADTYVQFDTGTFPEGVYVTRLIAREQAPRPRGQRLSCTFEMDNLVIDRTPPVINATQATRSDNQLHLAVEGTDALSLLEGADFVLNNGTHESVTHPADGILDSRHERFELDLPEARTAGATSVEVLLYDQSGNSSSVRLPLK